MYFALLKFSQRVMTLCCVQVGSVNASLLDSEEEEDREGLTCAVCLDIYVSPYSCQPCGHIFCEPCLRTLARNRPSNTPCPLCRTLISHTDFHKGVIQAKVNSTWVTLLKKSWQLIKLQHFDVSFAVVLTVVSGSPSSSELNQTAKTFFPKLYCARKKNFQNAPCAKWPLPTFHKHTFRTLWGEDLTLCRCYSCIF